MKFDDSSWREQPEKNDQQTTPPHAQFSFSEEENQALGNATIQSLGSTTLKEEQKLRRQRILNQVLITLTFMTLAFLGGWFSHQAYTNSLFTTSSASQKYANLIQQAWGLIDQNYVDRKAVNYQQMSYDAIRSMLTDLGDTGHTRFLTPQDVQAEQQSLSGSFAGIGVYIHQDTKTKDIIITSTISGAPAEKAGIQHGDVIIGVNGKDVVGMDFSTVQ
ncbi:MAG: S41 family peptidase, partial [Rhabdochlamydiaceae bacterium]